MSVDVKDPAWVANAVAQTKAHDQAKVLAIMDPGLEEKRLLANAGYGSNLKPLSLSKALSPDALINEDVGLSVARSVASDPNHLAWSAATKSPVIAESLAVNHVPGEPLRAYHGFSLLCRSLTRSCDWQGYGSVDNRDLSLLKRMTGGQQLNPRGTKLPRAWVEDMLGVPQGTVARTGGTESSGGATYGFAVKPDWSSTIFRRRRQLRGPLADCVWIPTTALEFEYPCVDETNVSAGKMAGGITLVRRASEATALSTSLATDGTMGMIHFRLASAIIDGQFSRDLLADQYGVLEEYLGTVWYQEVRERLESWMFLGTGSGPGSSETTGFSGLGVVYAPCTIQADRTTNSTLDGKDIDLMMASLYGPSYEKSCWYCSKSAFNKLVTLQRTNGAPVVMDYPQGGSAWGAQGASSGGNVLPYILGRPLVVMNQLPALGSVGDVVLADFSQYGFAYHKMDNTQSGWEAFVGVPGESVEAMSSDHVWFDTDQVALRLKARIDCKPLWRSSVLDRNSTRVSPFVVLSAAHT